MAKKARKPKYPLSPVELRGGKVWFYQAPKGISVVTQLREKNGYYLGTTVADIPWKHLIAAVANHRRATIAKRRS